MKLVKTVFSDNSIKWKVGMFSISRLLIDKNMRIVMYFLGIRIFREPLESILKLQNAKVLINRLMMDSTSVISTDKNDDENREMYKEFFRTMLRLQAWNIVSKQSRNSYNN